MKQFIDEILRDVVQDFIWSQEHADVHELLLKHKYIETVPAAWIAQQILGRRKAKDKLPTWYSTKGIIYPPSLNLAQSSSEATAQFKSTLLQTAGNGADLTGGFGVDTLFLSRQCPIDYIEPNPELLEIAKHNHQLLSPTNIVYHHKTAETFLQSYHKNFGILYLDPSRRRNSKKVFRLEDCEPDTFRLRTRLMLADTVLIKTSPLYDIVQGCRDLPSVAQVIVLAVENECKELLFLLQKNFSGEPLINSVNLYPKKNLVHSLSFTFGDERVAIAQFSQPLTYLYEPNASILKAGAFKWVSQKYKLNKLAINTHLYTSEVVMDFPGRIFKVKEYVHLDKKLKSRFNDGQANILTRNFPLSVEEIKKKTGLHEGGIPYLICFQTEKEKFSLIADRIK